MAQQSRVERRHHVDPQALSAAVFGWGADLDPVRRPAVPKEKVPPEGTGAHWQVPDRQVPQVKIFRSTEHRALTPVFGTACPPRGWSGWLRGRAYGIAESRASHWLLLLLADRIDVLENSIHWRGLVGRPKSGSIAVWGLVAGITLAFVARTSDSTESARVSN